MEGGFLIVSSVAPHRLLAPVQAWPGSACTRGSSVWASGQAGVRLPQRLGTGSAVRVVLAEVPPPFPPLEPAPTLLRGRGTSTSTLLHRQETAALRAQGMGG